MPRVMSVSAISSRSSRTSAAASTSSVSGKHGREAVGQHVQARLLALELEQLARLAEVGVLARGIVEDRLDLVVPPAGDERRHEVSDDARGGHAIRRAPVDLEGARQQRIGVVELRDASGDVAGELEDLRLVDRDRPSP